MSEQIKQNVKPDWFWHLTMNTGDTRKSFRTEVGDSTLELLRSLKWNKGVKCAMQADLPMLAGYSVKVTAKDSTGVFSVHNRKGAPLVLCMLMLDSEDESYWNTLEQMYLNAWDNAPIDFVAPEKPSSSPWLGVVLLPEMFNDPSVTEWLGDFERCVAWMLIEDHPVWGCKKHESKPTADHAVSDPTGPRICGWCGEKGGKLFNAGNGKWICWDCGDALSQ